MLLSDMILISTVLGHAKELWPVPLVISSSARRTSVRLMKRQQMKEHDLRRTVTDLSEQLDNKKK